MLHILCRLLMEKQNEIYSEYESISGCGIVIFPEIMPKLGSDTSPGNYREKVHVIHRAIIYVFTEGTWHDRTWL